MPLFLKGGKEKRSCNQAYISALLTRLDHYILPTNYVLGK